MAQTHEPLEYEPLEDEDGPCELCGKARYLEECNICHRWVCFEDRLAVPVTESGVFIWRCNTCSQEAQGDGTDA